MRGAFEAALSVLAGLAFPGAAFVATACATARSGGRGDAPRRPSIAGPAGSLAVDDGGKDEPAVLFVHGNGGNRSQWAETLAHLRPTRRAVAFDLRGMGESAPDPHGNYSVAAFASDVAAVADALDLRRFFLVAHSFGGAVACAYAGAHPDRLAALLLVDVAGDLTATPPDRVEGLRRGLSPENYAQFTDAWFASILAKATPQTRDAVLRSLHATRPDVFTAASLALYSFRLDEALARYPGPRLAIASYLAESPFAIHRGAANVPVRVVADASHWVMMDRPVEVDRILDEFLASSSRP